MSVQNHVQAIRQGRGIAAADLAARAGVSRQTIYAIEQGSYVPNTEVGLRLARALSVTVEELFRLPEEPAAAPEEIRADPLSATPAAPGQPVRVCRVADRPVSIPVDPIPYFLPDADGVVTKSARVAPFARAEAAPRQLVMAGCDPALGLLVRLAHQLEDIDIVPAPASSHLALTWLQEGKIHAAGSHLRDSSTGDSNLPYLRRHFPREDFAVVAFGHWEEGFVVAAGNPKKIQRAEDLARRGLRLVNREKGSGSRALLDRLLVQAGVAAERVKGYDREARGHLAAAYRVASGDADCCVATSSAARAYGLAFVPLEEERYDLVLRRDTVQLGPMERVLGLLQRSALRRKLETLAGYDTRQTGAVLA